MPESMPQTCDQLALRPNVIVDDELWIFEVGDFEVGGESFQGGTVSLNWKIDADREMTVARARKLATALLAAADHAQTVGR